MSSLVKKIIIAIKNDFLRQTYFEIFQKEGFLVFKTGNGKEAFNLAKKEKPDIILADVALSELDGFGLMEKLKKEESTQRIPVVVYAQFERKEDKIRAIELEAKDFITAADVTPFETIRRVKIALGEQKSYRVAIQYNLYNAKELVQDLSDTENFQCPKCGTSLILYLIKDLSRGENQYKVSLICPKCS